MKSIVLFTVWLAFGWTVWAIAVPLPPRPPVIQPTAAEKRWIEQRHKFHGIDVSIEENGQHYFIRNGKRCKL